MVWVETLCVMPCLMLLFTIFSSGHRAPYRDNGALPPWARAASKSVLRCCTAGHNQLPNIPSIIGTQRFNSRTPMHCFHHWYTALQQQKPCKHQSPHWLGIASITSPDSISSSVQVPCADEFRTTPMCTNMKSLYAAPCLWQYALKTFCRGVLSLSLKLTLVPSWAWTSRWMIDAFCKKPKERVRLQAAGCLQPTVTCLYVGGGQCCKTGCDCSMMMYSQPSATCVQFWLQYAGRGGKQDRLD